MKTKQNAVDEIMRQMDDVNKRTCLANNMLHHLIRHAQDAAAYAGLDFSEFTVDLGVSENIMEFIDRIDTILLPELLFYSYDEKYAINPRYVRNGALLEIEDHLCKNEGGKFFEFDFEDMSWKQAETTPKSMRKLKRDSSLDLIAEAFLEGPDALDRCSIHTYLEENKLLYFLLDDVQECMMPVWDGDQNSDSPVLDLYLELSDTIGKGFRIQEDIEKEGKHVFAFRHYIDLEMFDDQMPNGYSPLRRDTVYKRDIFKVRTPEGVELLEKLLWKISDEVEERNGANVCVLPLSLHTFVVIKDVADMNTYTIHTDREDNTLTQIELTELKKTQKAVEKLITVCCGQ